jgi:hypothetical protein
MTTSIYEAGDDRMVPDDDQMPEDDQMVPEELTADPAGAVVATILSHLPPLCPSTRALPSQWPARSPGQPVTHLLPSTAHARLDAGTRSRRCSSTIRVPLLSWPLASWTTVSRRTSGPSRSGSIHCYRPGGL